MSISNDIRCLYWFRSLGLSGLLSFECLLFKSSSYLFLSLLYAIRSNLSIFSFFTCSLNRFKDIKFWLYPNELSVIYMDVLFLVGWANGCTNYILLRRLAEIKEYMFYLIEYLEFTCNTSFNFQWLKSSLQLCSWIDGL